MKKKVILLTLSLMLLAAGVVSAAANWGKFEGYNIVRLVIDGKTVAVNDTPPVILKGRTMVPISMLEAAGVKATWDKDSYTVNVESSKSNIGNSDGSTIKQNVVAMDFFKSLDDLGESLASMGVSLDTAYNGVVNYRDRSSLDDNYDYMDNKINNYNYLIEEFEKLEPQLKKAGVNIDEVNTIFNYYYDAIEYYKEGFTHLETLTTNPKNSASNTSFFDSLTEGNNNSYDGSEICINRYYDYRDIILYK